MPATSAIKKTRPSAVPASEFLSTQQAAAYLNLSASYLNKARLTGDGPRFRKFGHTVRYAKADLIAWTEAAARRSTSDNGEAA